MSGDKTKKAKYGLRNNPGSEMEKEVSANTTELASEQHGDNTVSLDLIRGAMSEVMTAEMATLRAELKTDLQDFRSAFHEDMKRQMDEFTKEVHLKLQESAKRVDHAEARMKQIEDNMAETERWDIGVKDALIQLMQNQHKLHEKVTEMEGRARRNNIRIYGVAEDSEGTSMIAFIEDLIKREFGNDLGQDYNLCIERAHRALGLKPPATAPPRSIVVYFLRFTVKEAVLRAAWKRPIHINNKQVYFDHDYALDVQKRRKEYIPIKRALKAKGIRFQTPLSKMRVFFDSGSILYNSATEAADDLPKRGIAVVKTSTAQAVTEETLKQLLPWETQTTHRGNFHKSIRERLNQFRRTPEDSTEDS